MANNLILRLRATDSHGSDRASWELRQELSGFQWYAWPASSVHADWEKVAGLPPFFTDTAARVGARFWFKRHAPELRLEITSVEQEATT